MQVAEQLADGDVGVRLQEEMGGAGRGAGRASWAFWRSRRVGLGLWLLPVEQALAEEALVDQHDFRVGRPSPSTGASKGPPGRRPLSTRVSSLLPSVACLSSRGARWPAAAGPTKRSSRDSSRVAKTCGASRKSPRSRLGSHAFAGDHQQVGQPAGHRGRTEAFGRAGQQAQRDAAARPLFAARLHPQGGEPLAGQVAHLAARQDARFAGAVVELEAEQLGARIFTVELAAQLGHQLLAFGFRRAAAGRNRPAGSRPAPPARSAGAGLRRRPPARPRRAAARRSPRRNERRRSPARAAQPFFLAEADGLELARSSAPPASGPARRRPRPPGSRCAAARRALVRAFRRGSRQELHIRAAGTAARSPTPAFWRRLWRTSSKPAAAGLAAHHGDPLGAPRRPGRAAGRRRRSAPGCRRRSAGPQGKRSSNSPESGSRWAHWGLRERGGCLRRRREENG